MFYWQSSQKLALTLYLVYKSETSDSYSAKCKIMSLLPSVHSALSLTFWFVIAVLLHRLQVKF